MPPRPPVLPCPTCGASSRPILWGLVDGPIGAAGEDGWALGGCCIEEPRATHRCENHHDFRVERYAQGWSPEDRAVGALLGLATGDAVGTTLEFARPGSFEPITDLVGGGPFQLAAGEWTDDTSMALCLAESLLDTGGMDLADQLRRYVLWRDHGYLSSTGTCFDIGVTTSRQLARFQRTGEPVDPEPNDESAANGSLMRLAPVAIRWHPSAAESAERAGESSTTTHAARRPVDACRLLGAMLAALIRGRWWNDVASPKFWRWGQLHPEVEAIARGSWRTREPPGIRGTGYCVDALEAAIWAVDGADDFTDAVLRAANLGDDADTTAAIAGQLAGARWGECGIPERWKDKIVDRERIRALALGLCRASGDGWGALYWPHDELQHAWWVDDPDTTGRVLAGEYPAKLNDARRSNEVLNLLLDHGVRTFIDLTEADELDPYDGELVKAAALRGLDVEHIRFAIRDLDVRPDAGYDEILGAIERGRSHGNVYVHCWGGVGRTGTVIGCLLAAQGHGHDRVTAELERLRWGTRKASRPCPETDSQHALLRRRCNQ